MTFHQKVPFFYLFVELYSKRTNLHGALEGKVCIKRTNLHDAIYRRRSLYQEKKLHDVVEEGVRMVLHARKDCINYSCYLRAMTCKV